MEACPEESELCALALGQPAEKTVENHVKTCSTCQSKVQAQKVLFGALREAARGDSMESAGIGVPTPEQPLSRRRIVPPSQGHA